MQSGPTSSLIDVLIVEDSATQAEQLKDLLEQQGHVVTVAINGAQALAAMRNGVPALVISDVVMPEMDGYSLCRAIKADENLKQVPVVLVTSLSSMQDIVKGLACGADNFIRKPYDPGALLARIEYILLNQALRRDRKTQVGLEIYLGGEKHFITSEKEQILDLLVSSYEEAIKVTEELKLREREISVLNMNLEERAAELEAANKELEAFSYSVSHDLRTPLRAIDGYSQMIEEHLGNKLDDAGRRLLDVICDSSRKMSIMIDDLLAFSKLGRQPMRNSKIDMTSLVSEVWSEIRTGSPEGEVAFQFQMVPAAWGDRALLKQVWANLLSNALKYSGKTEQPTIEVSGEERRSEIVYRVKDNGAGFDMSYYDKLFEVFQRLHSERDFSGTGVGLAIVQRVVTRHGGRVWAEGKVGAGATFFFSLPVKNGRSA